jgi:DNA polymerase (family X)
MKLEDAQVYAEKVVAVLQPFCSCIMTAGSIRRGKAEVGDIDIVAIPKAVEMPGGLLGSIHYDEVKVWMDLIPIALLKAGFTDEALGPELLRFNRISDGFQVDVYRARPETWGVILLIRTGSKEHNVKLCTLAKSKGLMLSASQGVLASWIDGRRVPEEKGKIIASRTEEEIFAALGLAFVEPHYREATL